MTANMVVAAPLNCSPHSPALIVRARCAEAGGKNENEGVLMTSFSCAHTEKDDVDGKVENSSLCREL